MILVDTARKACDYTAGIGIPVGGAKAGEGGDDVAAVRVAYPLRKVLRVRRGVNHAHFVAEPLNCSTCHIDRAFKRVIDFSVKSPCDGRQKTVL